MPDRREGSESSTDELRAYHSPEANFYKEDNSAEKEHFSVLLNASEVEYLRLLLVGELKRERRSALDHGEDIDPAVKDKIDGIQHKLDSASPGD